MKRWQRSVWMAGTLLLLTLVGAGCATARAGGDERPISGASSQIITREQIMESSARNAWDVLRSTVHYIHWGITGAGAPQRATRRGVTSGMGPERVRIVVDGTTLVNLSDLTLIPTRDLEEIRVLSGIDATTYFGTNSVAGAVLITTRR